MIATNKRLRRIEMMVELLFLTQQQQGAELMALGQDILDMVTAEDTKVDSVIALLNGLVASGTIPQSVVDAVKAKIQGSEDKLDAAIAANTPPVTP